MEKDIKKVQLEASAFLTDIDFQMMSAEERGVYCSIIFYLYANGGEIELSHNKDITLLSNTTFKLALLSNCTKTGSEWEDIWNKISKKFIINGNILSHKRVTEELLKAENYIKSKSEAGKKGMENRWKKSPDDNTVNNNDITIKYNLNKYNNNTNVNLNNKSLNNNITVDEDFNNIIAAWKKIKKLPPDKLNISPSEEIAISREIAKLANNIDEPIRAGTIIEAIENYNKALNLKNSQTYPHKLFNFLAKGHIKNYVSWAFDINAHDKDYFNNKNNKQKDLAEQVEEAKKKGIL